MKRSSAKFFTVAYSDRIYACPGPIPWECDGCSCISAEKDCIRQLPVKRDAVVSSTGKVHLHTPADRLLQVLTPLGIGWCHADVLNPVSGAPKKAP